MALILLDHKIKSVGTAWREKGYKRGYIRHSEVNAAIIKWHLHDLAPIFFKISLLGKYSR
jgi:hypothetical protein